MEVNARVGEGRGELQAGGPLPKFPRLSGESESNNKTSHREWGGETTIPPTHHEIGAKLHFTNHYILKGKKKDDKQNMQANNSYVFFAQCRGKVL
jgi:hypothetical protein